MTRDEEYDKIIADLTKRLDGMGIKPKQRVWPRVVVAIVIISFIALALFLGIQGVRP